MADTYVVTGATSVTKNGSAIANVQSVELIVKNIAATPTVAAYTEAQLVVRVTDSAAQTMLQNLVANVDTTAKNAYTNEIAKNLPFDVIKSQPGDTITWSAGNITATSVTEARSFN